MYSLRTAFSRADSNTPPAVLCLSNWIQMCGIYARGIATKMVKHHPFRDRAFMAFVNHAMCHLNLSGIPVVKMTIPQIVLRFEPYPTATGIIHTVFQRGFSSVMSSDVSHWAALSNPRTGIIPSSDLCLLPTATHAEAAGVGVRQNPFPLSGSFLAGSAPQMPSPPFAPIIACYRDEFAARAALLRFRNLAWHDFTSNLMTPQKNAADAYEWRQI